MPTITLKAPAKINLYLRVVNKRDDGFHNIETLFQRIDLCDVLKFTTNSTGNIRITCNHPHVPTGPKNLVYQVAQILRDQAGISYGVDVEIQKNIPVAAGLAGGSTNAATALLGLNQLWNLGLTRAQMVSIAKKLGSDIAFFLYDVSWAVGTDKGDHIRPVQIKSKFFHVLAVPCVRMYSWKVYGGFKMKLTKDNDNVNILIRNLKNSNILEAGRLLRNDLETEILRLSPRLSALKDRLKILGSKGVMVSGSGPSVFGLTESQVKAEKMKQFLQRRFKQVFVVRTL